MKQVIFFGLVMGPYFLLAQFFSGYYESTPLMEGFDHFEIKHLHGEEGRYEGVFTLHAFVGDDEMWSEEAVTIHGEEADYFISQYGEGRDILSVHKMRILWDGLEWEFFLLGYMDHRDHGRFIVVEELFTDASETQLKDVRKYHWAKVHHLSLKGLVKHR
jgi:hypothetical protein